MTFQLFAKWLTRFDDYVSRTPGRRVALVVDNATCYGRPETLPHLRNVEIFFLPKNATSRVQPLDSGIIACIKRGFRRHQLEMGIKEIEGGNIDNLYNTNLLTAIKIIYSAWSGLDSTIIHNCWIQSGLIVGPQQT